MKPRLTTDRQPAQLLTMLIGVTFILVGLLGFVPGIAGVLRTAATARLYLIGGGVVYLVLWFYGLVIAQNGGANFVPFNTADNWLHFAIGAAMIGLGFATTRARPLAPAI